MLPAYFFSKETGKRPNEIAQILKDNLPDDGKQIVIKEQKGFIHFNASTDILVYFGLYSHCSLVYLMKHGVLRLLLIVIRRL